MSSENLNQKIANQIEYYFGDVNLPKDKFLRDLVGKEEGWVPISTLIRFKRLEQLAGNAENVVKALEEIKSDLIELNESKDKIRRSVELPSLDNESKLEYKLKTIHIKGFPVDATLDDCINFCSQYGKVQSVQMKKMLPEKTFKGCIFVIFQDVESANKALSSNDKFKGEIELGLRENKEQYYQRKKGTKKGKKDNKLVKLEDNEEAEKTTVKSEENCDKKMANDDEEAKEEEPEEDEEIKYEKGCCVKLMNVPEGTHYRQIRPQLTEYGSVQYVDLMPETQSGLVRFATKEDADKALKAFAYTETANGKANENANGVKEEKVTDENAEQQDENIDAEKEVEKEQTNDEQDENIDAEKEVEKEQTNDEQNDDIDLSKLQKIKIESLILSYQVLEGEEEAEYWKSVRKLKSENLKKIPNNKTKKFNKNKGYNKKNARFGKRKNYRGDNDRSAKKVKSEN